MGLPVDVDGNMYDPSARKYRLGDALCRLCSEKDETSWMPAQCLGFDGNSCDGNSFELKTHPQTGRPIRYGAGKGTFLCETCAKAFYWCPHGRRRSKCKECGGSEICEHGRVRYGCKACARLSRIRARDAKPPLEAKVEIKQEFDDVEDPGEEDYWLQ